MKEMHITGNLTLFDLPAGLHEGACVTTNGIIKKNGRAVMGRGIAKYADERFNLGMWLASSLRTRGNHAVFLIHVENANGRFPLLTFPTKHDWRDPSDLALIVRSARELVAIANDMGLTRCYLPRPGCSNGRLSWQTVKPAIETILDDRFVIVTNGRFD